VVKIITSFFFALLFAPLVNAAEVRVSASQLTGLFERDGSGLYDKVFAAIGAVNGETYNLKILPPLRAENAFRDGDFPCATPFNKNKIFYDWSFSVVEGAIFTEAKIYIFTAPGTTAIHDLSTLVGKKIGITQGVPLGSKVYSAGLNLKKSPSIKANIKKLQKGRLDAFLAYWPDVYTAFDELNISPFPHVIDTPVSIHNDTLLCRADQNGEAIITKFNEGFKIILKNGTLDKIFD